MCNARDGSPEETDGHARRQPKFAGRCVMSNPEKPNIELDPAKWPRVIATISVVQELTTQVAEAYNVPELADALRDLGRQYLELGLAMGRLDAEWTEALVAELEAFDAHGCRLAGLSDAEIQQR